MELIKSNWTNQDIKDLEKLIMRVRKEYGKSKKTSRNWRIDKGHGWR